FVLPEYMSIDSAKLTTLISAVLFFWGPLGGVVGGMPMYTRSSIALANIEALEEKLEKATQGAVDPEKAEDPWRGQFSRIDVQHGSFTYGVDAGGDAFRMGPMDLTINAGEVVFVVGGNGSGKSTFMKMLTGLYPAMSGGIRMDGVKVEPENA